MATIKPIVKRSMPTETELDKIERMTRDKKIVPIKHCKRKRDDAGDDNSLRDAELARRPASARSTLKKQKKEAGFLDRRLRDRLNGIAPKDERRPRDIVAEKIKEYECKPYRQGFLKLLKELSTDRLTGEQLARLEDASKLGPNYVGRTASLRPGHRWGARPKAATNGFTTEYIMMPAADTHSDQGSHKHISRLPQGTAVYMVGHHLIWTDGRSDQILSYSKDFLFLFVHALGRASTGQGDVTIQIVDRRKATTAKGTPAQFYPALEIAKALEIWRWKGWTDPQRGGLLPRKFTHEFLSHGTIVLQDDRFVQARLDDLIELGLYELFSYFKIPLDGHRRSGLYTSEVACRRVGYPPNNSAKARGEIYSYEHCGTKWPATPRLLELVQKLARLFTRQTLDANGDEGEPHLHVFLGLLTFHKRTTNDPEIARWITTHYTATDVIDRSDDGHGGIQPGFTHVASNLPGYMQYLDLIRIGRRAFGLSDLPDNVVEERIGMHREIYKESDNRHQPYAVSCYKCDAYGERSTGSDDEDDEDDDSQKGKKVIKATRAGVLGTTVDSMEVDEAQTSNDAASKQLPGDPSLDEDGDVSDDYARGRVDMQPAIEASLTASNTSAQTTADNLEMA